MQIRSGPVPLVAALTLTGLLAACSPSQEPAPTGTSTGTPATTQSTSAAAPSVPSGSQEAGAGGFTEAQTADLCARMEAQLQSWRTYTPSIGRGGLNILVGEWGAANGIDLFALAGDRSRIDAATSAQCPEVREEAIRSLEIPDLASGLVGF